MTRADGAEFTRARIARACRDALHSAGVLGVLPTPLEAVAAASGVRERVAISDVPAGWNLRSRLLGALWFEQRMLFVDERQSPARRRFTEAHEIAHLLLPWHAAALRLDTADELFGALARGLEAEANLGASELIFQGDAFAAEAAGHDRSLRTPFALASAFGASRHAAAHHYVERHREPLALLVAGRWPARDGRLPVWRSVESASFRGRLPELRGAPLAEAVEAARRTNEPVECALGPFRAEVVNNRHCHLVLVAA